MLQFLASLQGITPLRCRQLNHHLLCQRWQLQPLEQRECPGSMSDVLPAFSVLGIIYLGSLSELSSRFYSSHEDHFKSTYVPSDCPGSHTGLESKLYCTFLKSNAILILESWIFEIFHGPKSVHVVTVTDGEIWKMILTKAWISTV